MITPFSPALAGVFFGALCFRLWLPGTYVDFRDPTDFQVKYERMNTMELKILPPLLVLILVAAMWWLSKITGFASIEFGLTNLLSVTLLLVGLLIDVAAIVMFRRARTTVNPMKPKNATQLVHGGIYNRSRNPMYLASLVMLLAWGIWLANIVSLIVLPFFVWYITRFQIRPEERVLGKLFPDEYAAYKSRVRRWL